MKKLLCASIFGLFFCVAVFSQNGQSAPCPAVRIASDGEIPQLNKPFTFTAALSEDAGKYDIKYDWSVAGGEIFEGQGTPSIKVLPKNPAGENLTATVMIKGLPENCGFPVDSETAPVCSCVPALLLDSFSLKASKIDKIKLDNLAVQLRNDPNAAAYIFEKFKRGTSANLINQKLQKTIDYLTEKNIEKDRIVIKTSFSDKNSTEFWIIPAGAEPSII